MAPQPAPKQSRKTKKLAPHRLDQSKILTKNQGAASTLTQAVKQNYNSWLEISASALLHNIQNLNKISKPSFQLGSVLKGNAYGHGLLQVFSIVRSQVDAIYLISAQDAFELRKLEREQDWQPSRLIVIGAISLNEAILCSREQIEVVIGGLEWKTYWKRLRKEKLRLKVHVHLDTGLAREGFRSENLLQDLSFLKTAQDTLHLVGIMSHFANTEDVTEQSYALSQLAEFKAMSARLKKFLKIQRPLEEHLSASAGAMILPEARLSIVRVGISLYGLWPSVEARISSKLVLKTPPELKPVLNWKCQSQVVKWIKKGSYVGYGCTYRCNQDTRIAVFPVGYFDGYPRIASGKAHVLINQKRCPILGRIMMNHIIVDVTQVESKNSRLEAVLIGTSGKETISAESLANWAQTIHYEVITRIAAHLPRIVTKTA
jgi:alanine racemase